MHLGNQPSSGRLKETHQDPSEVFHLGRNKSNISGPARVCISATFLSGALPKEAGASVPHGFLLHLQNTESPQPETLAPGSPLLFRTGEIGPAPEQRFRPTLNLRDASQLRC